MDLSSISAATTSLQAVGQIAKGLISLHTLAEVQSKAIELNEKLIAAQQDVFAAYATQSVLVERIGKLEEKIGQLEAWETEKQRYELKEVTSGTFAYALKEGMQPPEPFHRICANCYARGEKSILQERSHPIGRAKSVGCDNCGAEIYTSGAWNAGHTPRVVIRRPRD